MKLVDAKCEDNTLNVSGPGLSYKVLVDLYEFADRRDVQALSDYIFSLMLEGVWRGSAIPSKALDQLLEKAVVGKGSRMFQMLVDIATRRHCCSSALLLVDIAARFVDIKEFEQTVDGIPIEFVIAILGPQREITLDETPTAVVKMNEARQPDLESANHTRRARHAKPASQDVPTQNHLYAQLCALFPPASPHYFGNSFHGAPPPHPPGPAQIGRHYYSAGPAPGSLPPGVLPHGHHTQPSAPHPQARQVGCNTLVNTTNTTLRNSQISTSTPNPPAA